MKPPRLEFPIKSRRHAIDLINNERRLQGYTSHGVSMAAGYSQNYLGHAVTTGAISLQTAVDYFQVLGMELIVRRVE